MVLEWKTGDTAWVSLDEVKNLEALSTYLEAQGVNSAKDLPKQISRSESLPILSLVIKSETDASIPSVEDTRKEIKQTIYSPSCSQSSHQPSSQGFDLVLKESAFKEDGIMKKSHNSSKTTTTPIHTIMTTLLNSQYAGASKRVIARDIANGKLTPLNFMLSPSVANYLKNNPTAFNFNFDDEDLGLVKPLSFMVIGKKNLLLWVPDNAAIESAQENGKFDRACVPYKEHDCPKSVTATALIRSPSVDHGHKECSALSPNSIANRSYPDHLHLRCISCSKAFTRKALPCPACTHPLDIPVQSVMVNNDGCGYVYSPFDVVLGGTVKYINIPKTFLWFNHCNNCEADIGDSAVEIPCLRCREFGFPPEYAYRSDTADPRSKEFPIQDQKRITWDDVKPPVTRSLAHQTSFVQNHDVRNQKPIPTGPRNPGKRFNRPRHRGRSNKKNLKPVDYAPGAYNKFGQFVGRSRVDFNSVSDDLGYDV